MKIPPDLPNASADTDPPELTVCAVASGSKGNATCISDGETTILIDAGLSGREIERRMAERGLSMASVRAIVISHEHSDHIKGVGVLSRRYDIPVYITPKTLSAAGNILGKAVPIRHFECGAGFAIGRLRVHPFAISHDAADPAGFTVSRNGLKVGVATDLGVATAMVQTHLRGCDILVLEANHDPDMLIAGPYPWHLKQRIKGRTGHLSNYDAKALLASIRDDKPRHVVLGHLSEKNNLPEIALRTVGEALSDTRIRLSVACQERCGEIIRIVQSVKSNAQ